MSVKKPQTYTNGSDRYIKFAEDYLDKELAETQKTILRSLANNQRNLIVSGNGPGKTFSMAIGVLAFLYSNPDSTVMGTSGSYTQFVDTLWRPLDNMHSTLTEEQGLPGRILGGNRPRLEIDDEWYAKVISPREPGELEGRHGKAVLVVIEESDKPYITEEHFDSANSSITDANDRLIAIANPPKDESNVVHEKMNSDRWNVIQFSSFESRNVQVDVGNVNEDRLPGVVDLPTVADDWEEWNDEPWPEKPDWCPPVTELKQRVDDGRLTHEKVCELLRPGFEVVSTAHEQRDDLDQRWYRRRVGIIPPNSAEIHRPIEIEAIREAYNETTLTSDDFKKKRIPDGAALDVARQGGDWNVLSAVVPDGLVVLERWQGVDHNVNEQKVREYIDDWPAHVPLSVDAQGEGSGLADRLRDAHSGTIRFHAGSTALANKKYYDKWAEGLDSLGAYLETPKGGFNDKRLREELLACSRSVSYEERYYKSRNAEVLKATKKDKVKDVLNRSPDVLDSAYMAIWAGKDYGQNKQRFTW